MRSGLLAFGRRVNTLRHVAHDRPHRIARLGKRDCPATPERDAALLPLPVVLREIRLASTRRYPHAKTALLIVENEHVLAQGRAFQAVDAIECELHGLPADPADPVRTR
jgi:hypothetical protein